MSKQDRQGVRTPADIERKYNLGSEVKTNSELKRQISQLAQTMYQYLTEINNNLNSHENTLNGINKTLSELIARSDIISEESGEIISLKDSSDNKLKNLIVYGKDTGVGDSITVTVGSTEITIPTPNDLYAVFVDEGGDYTDADGRQWLCDYIDFARGVYVQKIDTEGGILAEVIETPIAEETLSVYKELQTSKPNTEIKSNVGVWLCVRYVADTKAYIDNKFAELA